MNDTPLTQEIIDGRSIEGHDENGGLMAKVARHPIAAGAAILAGAGLAYVAVKTIQSAADSIAREVHIETSITIDRSPEELYSFWRDFRNLPLFSNNLESVTETGERTSHWVARGFGLSRVEWDAEIYNEKENELIAWRSLENADVTNAGSVRFQKAPAGHGTYVKVTLNYNPPAGKVSAMVAQLFSAGPGQLLKTDLRRFKQLMETGELATIDGQTSGRAAPLESEVTPTIATSANTEIRKKAKEAANTRA